MGPVAGEHQILSRLVSSCISAPIVINVTEYVARLVGGGQMWNYWGRVEVKVDQEWGTVCDTSVWSVLLALIPHQEQLGNTHL